MVCILGLCDVPGDLEMKQRTDNQCYIIVTNTPIKRGDHQHRHRNSLNRGGGQSHIIHQFSPYMVIGDAM